jgi:hypothetical protein
MLYSEYIFGKRYAMWKITYAFSSKEEGSGALLGGPAMVKAVCGGGGGVVCVNCDSINSCKLLMISVIVCYNSKLFRRAS